MFIPEEQSFKINGKDSFVHCIRIELDPETASNNLLVNYHYHEYIELLYFFEGEGYVYINENKQIFGEGSFIIINSKKAHSLWFRKPSKYFCVKIMPQVLYDGNMAFDDLKYVMPFISEKNQYVFSGEEIDGTQIVPLLSEIMDEWDSMNIGYDLVIRADILKIFAIIFRKWEDTGALESKQHLSPDIKKAMLYTIENYQNANEKDAAALCCLSYHYFSHRFKREVGKSYSDYICSLRINEAEKMLLSSDKSITDIATETGFSTTSYFISRFRNEKGITPAQYRKNLRKTQNVQ